ncbi:formyl transferase [Thermobifida halotolerans]|uniref:Formyl transferase n=1 Tax=Thermobifida halotolerans TaxID=483545 RepID=A0AA97LYS4_9ACTN|nr:formyltransferase family protein [Thermobifida halotolerans]UOE20737.1 formyl transferase [Thermobifida halotolerans]
MPETARVILLSEVNSKLGEPFLDMLHHHPLTDLAAVVTSPPGKLCDYFVADERQVDLEAQAKTLGVPVLRPKSVNAPEVVARLRALEPDYLIVGNFQQILKADLLAVPKVTSVNFHPSPLPRYAGLAPFYWMVRNGETDGAVTAIEMAAGVDTGAVLAQHATPLTGRETALELRTVQERANVLMLLDLIPQLAARTFTRTPQDPSERTYFTRPGPDDYRLDFAYPAHKVACHVRAGYRHPGAFARTRDGRTVTILSVGEPVVGPGEPPAPGLVRTTSEGVFVGCCDAWLRVLTVDRDGRETPAQTSDVLVDGRMLESSGTAEVAEEVLA